MFRLLRGLAHPVCPNRLCLRKPSVMKWSTPKQSSFPVPLLCFALIATLKRLLLNMIASRLPASQVKLRLWLCRCVQQCFHVCCNLAASLLVRAKSLPCCQQALCQKEVPHKLLAGCMVGRFFACADGQMAGQQDLITSGASTLWWAAVFVSMTEQPACLQVCVCCCGVHKAGL